MEMDHSALLRNAVHWQVRRGYDATPKCHNVCSAVIFEELALLDEKIDFVSTKAGVSLAQQHVVGIFRLKNSRRCAVQIDHS